MQTTPPSSTALATTVTTLHHLISSTTSNNKIQTLHHRFQAYGKNAREWMRKCIMMLPEIDRERVWEKKGFGSLTEYTARLAGMSHKTTTDGLRIMQGIEHMPAILNVVAERGIAIVRPVLHLLNQDNQIFWAKKMRAMSQHTLEMYVREQRIQTMQLISTSSPNTSIQNTLHQATVSLQNQNSPLDIFGERALWKSKNFLISKPSRTQWS